MKQEMWERIVSFPQFREWWEKKLRSKPDNLWDIKTGRPMGLEDRMLRHHIGVDDIVKFLAEQDFTIVIHNIKSPEGKSLIRAYIENTKLSGIENMLSESLFSLLLSYLEDVNKVR